MDGYTRQQIEELHRRITRLDRQNQALKHSLYFAISLVKKIITGFVATEAVQLCDRHLDSLKTLVSEHKNAAGNATPGGGGN